MPMTELVTVGRDAEVRDARGTAVCNLSLAYNYGQKGEDGKKPTQWIDAALWGKRAEAMAPYLKKGTKLVVTVEDLHMSTYTDRDGNVKPKLAGNIISIAFVPMPRTDGAPAAAPAQRAAPAPAPAPRPAPATTGYADMDDDVPF